MSTNPSSTHHHKLDLNSVRILVFSVNQHFDRFLLDSEARKCIQLSCYSMLKPPKQEFFEFSEHSILSNLFWGVEKLEAAVMERSEEQGSSLLRKSEQMLQVPALLDEDGSTGGVSNQFLVCCSYFYLSIIRKLQNEEWHIASHALQNLHEKINGMKGSRFYFDNRCPFTQDDNGLFLKYIEDIDPVDDKLMNKNLISSKCHHQDLKLPDSDTSITVCSHVGSLEGSEPEEMYNENNWKVKSSKHAGKF